MGNSEILLWAAAALIALHYAMVATNIPGMVKSVIGRGVAFLMFGKWDRS